MIHTISVNVSAIRSPLLHTDDGNPMEMIRMPELQLPPAADIPGLTALVLPFVRQFVADIATLPPEQRTARITKVLDALSGR